MELDAVILARRSIRKYLPQPVEEDKLAAVLEAARLCQSGKNRQPWRFMALTGAQKDAVADIMLRLFETEHPELPPYYTTSKHTAKVIRAAPVLILIFREEDEKWRDGDLLSIGAAVEHMALKAVDLGLGSLWIRDVVYTAGEIKALVGRPELHLVCAFALGYAAEAPAPRPRKALEELLLAPEREQ